MNTQEEAIEAIRQAALSSRLYVRESTVRIINDLQTRITELLTPATEPLGEKTPPPDEKEETEDTAATNLIYNYRLLDALPTGTVLQSAYGDVYRKVGPIHWETAGKPGILTSGTLFLPVQVLFS